MTRCPWCGYEYPEAPAKASPEWQKSCPQCKRGVSHPAATMPFSDEEGTPTVLSMAATTGSLSEGKKYALVVVSGNEPGKVFPIEKPRVTIGRMACDVTLEDHKLSRQHALIAINGNTARLEDLSSTNGTYVEGKRIVRADLDDRTEFRVGNHVLLFLMTDRETHDL